MKPGIGKYCVGEFCINGAAYNSLAALQSYLWILLRAGWNKKVFVLPNDQLGAEELFPARLSVII